MERKTILKIFQEIRNYCIDLDRNRNKKKNNYLHPSIIIPRNYLAGKTLTTIKTEQKFFKCEKIFLRQDN